MDHPVLSLEAVVRRPDAERTQRWQSLISGATMNIGEAWFFRLAIKNSGNASAREVQVFLRKVERVDESVTPSEVERFSPMNLKWTHSGKPTRDILLPEIPVFCDFIHVGDPPSRQVSGEDLNVAADLGILCLDVEVPTSGRGHLLEPGTYRFHLSLVAENFKQRPYTVEVEYSGLWSPDQDRMFTGFKMKKL
jgi:hypothetical protein